jgi:hypothetical protein
MHCITTFIYEATLMRFKFTSVFVLLIAGFMLFSLPAFGQQTGLSGVVTDSQGGGIPGASVIVKQVGGSSFHATTNAQGSYIVPSVTAAEYTITASASGFSTVEKKVLLLVGQLAQIDISLPIASASSTVIVEANDQLAIDTTSSAVAGNVTPKEVEDVPINGRNYVELSALVPGIKSNSFGNTPAASGQASNAGDAETGKFQITMDGLQVSQDSVGSSFGQPKFSQDAISQFQIITNRFDATSGRSAGIYVNVQTKTGTNQMHGGAFGYFRNSYFNAADPIAKKVLDFADQQYGGTFGGAIKRDKLWFFASYEGEHSPNTATLNPYVTTTAGNLFTHPVITKSNEYLGRLDFQPNEKNHFMLRGDAFNTKTDFVTQGNDPSQSYSTAVSSSGYVFDWNRNISDHLVNDFHAGFHYFEFENLPYYTTNSIVLNLPASTIGEPYNQPEIFDQYTQQYRDDLFWTKGKHTLRMGGEYLYTLHGGAFPQYLRGGLTGCSQPAGVTSSPALYNTFFPNGTLDPTNWNYAAINNFCGGGETFTQAFGGYTISVARNAIGAWTQDDWKILPRLTLNLGIRYDNDLGAYNTSYVPTVGLLTPNTNPNANFAPRVGFAYDPGGNGKTSIRGGAGLYFADQVANAIIDEELYSSTARALQATTSGNTASPLSLPTPFAGQNPTANPTGYVTAPQPVLRGSKTPYAFQASFGIARELPFKTTMTADLVHMRVYDDFTALSGNLLTYSGNPQQNLAPTTAINAANYASRVCGNGGITLDTVTTLATGAPKNGVTNGSPALQVCSNLFGGLTRNFATQPGAGVIADALQVGLKHATTHGFTAAVAYTWGRTKNSTGGAFSYPNKPFKGNIQQEWANGTDDQRHTLTVNGEYQWKYGLSISSLYHFGSGLAFATSSGSTVNGYTNGTRSFGFNVTGAQSAVSQPIAPGTTCPVAHCTTIYAPLSKVSYDANYGYWTIQRDGFRGTPYNRVDSRLQENFKIKERYHAIIAVEAFNLFNHSNYGNFATNASTGTGATAYGLPVASPGAPPPFEYQARSLQFIGRFSF